MLVAIWVVPICILTILGMDLHSLLVPGVIGMQCYLVYKLKNSQLYLIFTLYVFLYFIYLIPYFYLGMDLSEYSRFQKRYLFSQVLLEFFLFYAGIMISVIKGVNIHHLTLRDMIRIQCESWKQIFFLFLTLIVFIKVITQGESVLDTSNPYQTYMENLQTNSVLPLLLILLLFFLYHVISKKNVRKAVLIVVFAGLLYYCVTRGYRIILAPLFLLCFYLIFDSKLNTRTIILVFCVGVIAMLGVNVLKTGGTFSWERLFSESNDYVLSHHADNLYVCASGVGLIQDGDIGLEERLMLNIGFFAESIVPPSLLPPTMKYPQIITEMTQNGGGGLCIGGAYIMWGFAGIFLFGYFFSEFIRRTYSTNNMTWRVIGSIILIFSPNWFSYDFHVILRFSVIAFILYKFLSLVKIHGKKYIGNK